MIMKGFLSTHIYDLYFRTFELQMSIENVEKKHSENKLYLRKSEFIIFTGRLQSARKLLSINFVEFIFPQNSWKVFLSSIITYVLQLKPIFRIILGKLFSTEVRLDDDGK